MSTTNGEDFTMKDIKILRVEKFKSVRMQTPEKVDRWRLKKPPQLRTEKRGYLE